MCADIRDGREQLLPSKGRIQMSKTNYLQTVKSDLQRTAGRTHQQSVSLFDHLVGDREQRARNFETKRLNGLEIDGKLELSRLQNR